jgi:hypothetical protein
MEDFLLQLHGVYEYDNDLEMNQSEFNNIYYYMKKIKLYFNQLFDSQINKHQINNLLPNNTECLISFLIIEKNQDYYLCENCSCVYLINSLNEWFAKSQTNNCPHCSFVIDTNKIYINK